jgi:hypothetical protein
MVRTSLVGINYQVHVEIDGRKLAVRIMVSPVYELATADCFGVVLL